ncbi:MAG: OmpH family outer membrane protein [Thermoanaerobaculales bacterium]|nr:OmpH family outer membrane protein [Thermoanaerobaculales bacterium]
MKALGRWISTVVVMFAAVPAVAGNVGFLDTQGAIRGVQEGRRQLAILDVWANQKSDEVEALKNRVDVLTRQLTEQRPIASQEAIERLEADLLQAQRDFEDAGRTLKRDFDAKQRELLSEVAIRVRNVASEYAAANGFDAIFALDSQPLVYIADSSVITNAVIRLYDEKYPVEQ